MKLCFALGFVDTQVPIQGLPDPDPRAIPAVLGGNGHPGAEQRLNHTPLLVERPDRTGPLLHIERHPVMFLEHLESFFSKGWNPSDANLPK